MFNEEEEQDDPELGVREPRKPKNPPNEGGAVVELEQELVLA